MAAAPSLSYSEIASDAPGLQPRYDLSEFEMRLLTREFLRGAEPSEGRYLAMNFGHDHPMANVGRTLEREVFEASFGNDAATMQAEYGEYEEASEFIVVFDRQTQRPAGVLRTIHDSEAGFKSINDIRDRVSERDLQSLYGFNPGNAWDVGTLAVLPQYRGTHSDFQVSSLLYRSLLLLAEQRGIDHLVTIIDAGARRNLERLGIPFSEIVGVGPIEYLGSLQSYAMYGSVHEFRAAVAKRAERLSSPNALSFWGGVAIGGVMGVFGQYQRDVDGKRLTMGRRFFNREVARLATSLITGEGLDHQLQLNL